MIEHGVASSDGHDPDRKSFYVTIPSLDVRTPTSFFAVYNGSEASGKFCTTNIHQELHKHEEFDTNLRQALEDSLYRIDRQMKVTSAVYGSEHTDDPSVDKHSGSLPVKEIPFCGGISASIALIRGADSIIATFGSALCFISKDGKPNRLGTGSSPEDNVKMKNRDSADNFPRILTESMKDADFVMMASGSLLDLMPVQQLTDFVTERINLRVNMDTICNDLLCHCASEMADKVPSDTCILILRSKDREGDTKQQTDGDAAVSTEKEQDDTEEGTKMEIGKSLFMLQKHIDARVLALRDEVAEIAELSSAAAPTRSENKIRLMSSMRVLLKLGGEVSDIMKRLGLRPPREATILRSPIQDFSIDEAGISSGADDTLIFKFNEFLLVATNLITETSCHINEDFSEASYLSCRQKIGSTEMIFALLSTKKNLSEETQGWKEKIRQPLLNLQKQMYARVRALRDEVAEIAGISSAAAPTESENKIKLKICSIRALLRLGGEVADIMKMLGLCPLREGTVLRSPIHGFSVDDADISSGADDTLIFKFNEFLLVATNLITETSCHINEDFSEASYLSCRQKIGSTEMIFALLSTKKNLSEETQGWKEKIRQPLLNLQKQMYARVRALRDEVAEIAGISSAAAPTESENKIKLKICSIRALLRLGGEVADIMKMLGLCPLREGTVLRSHIHGFSIDDVFVREMSNYILRRAKGQYIYMCTMGINRKERLYTSNTSNTPPQTHGGSTTLSLERKKPCCARVWAFVKKSANCNSEGT